MVFSSSTPAMPSASIRANRNKLETDDSSLMRLIASPINAATLSSRIFFVTLTASVARMLVGDHQLLKRAGAYPRHRARRKDASVHRLSRTRRQLRATLLLHCKASRPNRQCPSTRMHRRSATSPITFITSETPARSRRLSTIASPTSSRLAIPRARATPPTSGDTIRSSSGL